LSQLKANSLLQSDDRITELTAALDTERVQHQQQIDALKWVHYQMIKDAVADVTDDKERIICVLRQQVTDSELNLAQAVTAAKAQVYEKVKLQFENGNREFGKIKSALKEASAALADKETELGYVKERLSQSLSSVAEFQRDLIECRAHAFKLQSILFAVSESLGTDSLPAAVDTPWSVDELDGCRNRIKDSIAAVNDLAAKAHTVTAANFSLEQTISSNAQTILDLEGALLVAEQKLAVSVSDFSRVQSDRDQQLTCVATLAKENTNLEENMERLQNELKEQIERTSGLRSMNEELLAMLEKSVP
jgi:chromosome segregation ATPase